MLIIIGRNILAEDKENAAWPPGTAQQRRNAHVEDQPDQDRSQERVGPWQAAPVVVNRGGASQEALERAVE